MTPNGALTTLYAFTGGNDGNLPYAGSLIANGNNFYGMTQLGGTNNFHCRPITTDAASFKCGFS